MPPMVKQIADHILYFNNAYSEEVKEKANLIFCEVWEKIPADDREKLETFLEYILVKPVNDSFNYNTAAITHKSTTQPWCKSWIMWYPFCNDLKKESIAFLLAHELAHVFFQHPQNKTNKEEAEYEANNYVLSKWKIKPSIDDKQNGFSNLDY